ncbi:MAG: class I SAM-dependent methyltransferase [Bosea sp. (in: a-proteobacteria)]
MQSLKDEIIALIRLEGPITVERYMGLCLGHPTKGYYTTRDPFGADGDFITAPEISQMFGELIGLWTAQVWHDMGSPSPIRLIELGPGRGTLMADALRAIGAAVPKMKAALEVHLVETSPVLGARQRRTLADVGVEITWHDEITAPLEGPVIILANEFMDALPVQQSVALPSGWHERLVGLDEQSALVFGLSAEAAHKDIGECELGDFMEIPRAGQRLVRYLADHVVKHGGAALLIDYGAFAEGKTDTLQGVKQHRFVDPLAEPGEADLTTQVNFERLATIAALANANVHGPAAQGAFLQSLGLDYRAEALKTGATAAQCREIDAAVTRLTSMGERGMGELFKVMAFSHASLKELPGLHLAWSPD